MHNMEIMAAGVNSKQSEESIESTEKTEKSSDEQFANRALPPIPVRKFSLGIKNLKLTRYKILRTKIKYDIHSF